MLKCGLQYCATHVAMAELTEHENYCGSRTDKCEQCGEFVMLKNFELHISSNHGFLKLNDGQFRQCPACVH